MPDDNVIPFPRQLRVVPQPASTYSPPPDLVEHDGRAYRLADLLDGLTPAERQRVDATAPRTAQTAWDEVVRLWPALTAEIAAATVVVE